MKSLREIILIISALFFLTAPALAQDDNWYFGYSGELSASFGFQQATNWQLTLGARYLPGFRFDGMISDSWSWDGEIRANLYGQLTSHETDGDETASTAHAYRLWGRLYTDQLGIRLGRQEISFGPGKILRAVKWFDQKDSQDPTGFSEGVNAILVRYYFANNANVWLWSLSGNTNVMGNATLPTEEDSVEVGGRFQMPVGSSEIALSVHQRTADFRTFAAYSTVPPLQALSGSQLAENKIGLDFIFDLGVGLYSEISLTRLAANAYYPREQIHVLLGVDYTFGIGDGLSATFETFGVQNNTSNLDATYSAIWSAAGLTDETTWVVASSFQYGFTLLDSGQLFILNVPEYEFSMLQAVWSRAYDNVTLNTSLFTGHCPGTLSSDSLQDSLIPGAACGTGVQFIFQYNH